MPKMTFNRRPFKNRFSSPTLYKVSTVYLTAGVMVDRVGNIVEAAPVLKWTVGKNLQFVEEYYREKGVLKDVSKSPYFDRKLLGVIA